MRYLWPAGWEDTPPMLLMLRPRLNLAVVGNELQPAPGAIGGIAWIKKT